jgi:hypothetical protein
MKHTLAIIYMAASVILSNLGAATSPEELADAVQSAIDSNDQAKLLNLLYSKGMSEEDLQLVERSQLAFFTDQELEAVTLGSLPPVFRLLRCCEVKSMKQRRNPRDRSKSSSSQRMEARFQAAFLMQR